MLFSAMLHSVSRNLCKTHQLEATCLHVLLAYEQQAAAALYEHSTQ